MMGLTSDAVNGWFHSVKIFVDWGEMLVGSYGKNA